MSQTVKQLSRKIDRDFYRNRKSEKYNRLYPKFKNLREKTIKKHFLQSLFLNSNRKIQLNGLPCKVDQMGGSEDYVEHRCTNWNI